MCEQNYVEFPQCRRMYRVCGLVENVYYIRSTRMVNVLPTNLIYVTQQNVMCV